MRLIQTPRLRQRQSKGMSNLLTGLLLFCLLQTAGWAGEIKVIYTYFPTNSEASAAVQDALVLNSGEAAEWVGGTSPEHGAVDFEVFHLDPRLPRIATAPIGWNCRHMFHGPAIIRIKPFAAGRLYSATFEMNRSASSPDKTMVIPPGQGAQITLQCSSNLVDWVTATNGIYTNVPSMKFFRIHSEKVP